MNYRRKYRDFFDTEVLKTDLKQKSVRGGLFTMAGEGINFVLRLASTAVLARILIPEYFGLLGMVIALTGIAERFKDLGLSIATIQSKEITHGQVSNLFWINTAVGLVIMTVIVLCSPIISSFYNDRRLTYICLVISSSFLWSGLTIQHQALLRRQMRFAQIALVNVGSTLLSISLAIFLAVEGFGYWALVWREVTRNLLVAAGTWALCPWVPGPPNRNSDVLKMARFGRDVTGFNLLVFLTDSLDQILLGKLFGAKLLGFYRQAYQLIMTPIGQLVFPVHYVAESALSVLQDDLDRYRTYYKKLVAGLAFISMPLAALAFTYSREIVLLVLGAQWVEAVAIFRIFTLAAFIRPVISTFGFVMITCGKSQRYFWLGAMNSAIVVIAIVAGIKWGPVGVAAGHVLSNYVVFLPLAVLAFRGTPVGVGLFFRSIFPSAACSLLMAIVMHLLGTALPINGSFYALALGFLVALAVYLCAIWVLPPGRATFIEIWGNLATRLRKVEAR
jgi:O-antigen/teichoic acid export membrane protein